jgi:demethylmenaquinone methyltransferase/2-methoxy-6-polyprenyl-1,4-benzoquinol methylase
MTLRELLSEQRRYYRERAPEYDDWWFRRGRYALPPEVQAQWDADVAEVEHALREFGAHGDVLELAAGTGLWTRHLATTADTVLALDASEEVLALNSARVDAPNVEYLVADLFEWTPPRRFDVCVFTFWHSHVPADLFDSFWRLVGDALRPAGRFFLVDSGFGDDAHRHAKTGTAGEVRALADGREFRIVKRYWRPDELRPELEARGWRCDLRLSANGTFLYGSGSR